MNSRRPKLNADTDALCTIAHDCGYQVGRVEIRYVRSYTPSFGIAFVARRYRLLRPRGYRADPERMAAVLALMGVAHQPHRGFIAGHRVFLIQTP